MTREASVLILFFVILMFGTKSFAQQNPAGYISIDCGSTVQQSTDPQTKLLWVDDKEYNMLGKKGTVQYPNRVNATSEEKYPGNFQALQSFAYFPEEEGQSKYCYELPLTRSNVSFILRAMFLHGNASELNLPIQFDVYVNDTHWIDLSFTEQDDLWSLQWIESIFFSPPGGRITNVCLVPNQGVPFISSLELRQLDPEGRMYAESFGGRTGQELYFTLLFRWNLGGLDPYSPAFSTVRYPDDVYDRLWQPGFITAEGIVNATQSIPEQLLGPDVNNIPMKVINDAWKAVITSIDEHDYDYEDPYPLYLSGTASNHVGSLTYGIFYSAILNETDVGNRTSVHMEVDGTDLGTFEITTRPSQKSYFHVLNGNVTKFSFTGTIFINAFEYFQQESFISPTTRGSDVIDVKHVQELFNMTMWQGDPCVPVAYDGITCSLAFDGSEWEVIELILSDLQNSSSLVELNKVQSGWSLPFLRVLAIRESNMNSDTFKTLLETVFNVTWLYVLDVSYNDINTLPDAQWWIDVANDSDYFLLYMDISHNHLTQLPRFVELPFSHQMLYLNMSSNNISLEFIDLPYFSNLSSLQILNASNNGMTGNIPLSLSFYSLPSLRSLDISNNKFSGEFPSDKFSPLNASHSFELIADENEFANTLDMTAWYEYLEAFAGNFEIHDAAFSSVQINITSSQIFSFVNNKISNIYPTAEHFRPLIENLMHSKNFNQSGVLLGGNPYCKEAKDFAHRYLCRYSFNDIVYENAKKNSHLAIILGCVLGGTLVLFLLAFLSVSICLLQKKVQALKMVEQELSNRKVQPPYFSYYDLKLATNYFSDFNELGRGSFGAVYKGVLADGTVIAVKRLFTSNKKQVLHEFLNEVVLITGIKHKNLIQLQGCCIENEERILVYGYAENGNLADALWGEDNKTVLSWRNRLKICLGVARGLIYLHEELTPRIIHRDIKSANILLDKHLNPKIADFGLAKHFLEEDDMHFTQVISGTRGYFAPEYIQSGMLTTKVDVYSFGILVLEIVSGRKCLDPLLQPEEIQLSSWALKLQRSGAALKLLDARLHSEFSELEVLKLIDIALMCVNTDPELRPTMFEVETMLLEGHERVFDILCATALKKGDNASSLYKIYNNIGIEMGEDIMSTLFSRCRLERRSQEAGSGASGSSELRYIEEHPLMSQEITESDSEASTPRPLISANARAECHQR